MHRLRHEHVGILVGVQTVIHDNPQLTTRLPEGRNPIRIILDSKLRIPLDARVITDGEAPTWIFTGRAYDEGKRSQLEQLGIKVYPTQDENSERVNLPQMLDILGAEEVSSVFVEGGAEVNASFVQQGLADKLVLYMAPKLVGGRAAPGFLGGEGVSAMSDAVALQDLSVTQVGVDWKIEGYFGRGK